jgi:hypothetical protein
MGPAWILAATLLLGAGEEASVPGQVGETMIEGSLSLQFADPYGAEASGSSPEIISLNIAPTVLHFFWENIALGGSVNVGMTHTTGKDDNSSGTGGQLGMTAIGGYNIQLSPGLSVMPRLGLQFVYDSLDLGALSETLSFAHKISLNLEISAPLLVHIGNYYIGVNPQARVGLFSSQTTELNGGTTINTDGEMQMVASLSATLGGRF